MEIGTTPVVQKTSHSQHECHGHGAPRVCAHKAVLQPPEQSRAVLQDLDVVEKAIADTLGNEQPIGPAPEMPIVPWQPHSEPVCKSFIDKELQHPQLTVTFKSSSEPFVAPVHLLRHTTVRPPLCASLPPLEMSLLQVSFLGNHPAGGKLPCCSGREPPLWWQAALL